MMHYGVNDSDKAILRLEALESAYDSLKMALDDLDDGESQWGTNLKEIMRGVKEEIAEAEENVNEHSRIFEEEERREYEEAV